MCVQEHERRDGGGGGGEGQARFPRRINTRASGKFSGLGRNAVGVWRMGMGNIWKDPEAGGQEIYVHLVQYSWDQSITLGSSQQEHG